jgi:uncharacterized membrane protein
MSFYELLLFVHIVGAAVWFGSGVAVQVQAVRAERADDRATLQKLLAEVEGLSKVLFIPASLVVLLAGIALVLDGPWSFGATWVLLGLVGYAATFFTGVAVVAPRAEQITKLIEEDGGMSPRAYYEARRMLALTKIDYVVLVLVIALMTIKPTGSDAAVLIAMAAVLVGGVALVLARHRAIAPPAVAAPAVRPG